MRLRTLLAPTLETQLPPSHVLLPEVREKKCISKTVSLHSKVRTEEHFWENCIFFGFMSSAIFDPFLSQTRKLKILHILPGLIPFWKVESNRLIYSLFDWDFWPPALGWLWVLTLSFLCVQSNDDQFNFWFHYQLRSHKLMSERSQSRTKSLSLLW